MYQVCAIMGSRFPEAPACSFDASRSLSSPSDLGEFTANRRTNAFNKGDEEACQIAFLSAVIALQTRAQEMGGDAVVDVHSTTRHQNLESATQYRCAAGNVVANVVLVGRVVKLK